MEPWNNDILFMKMNIRFFPAFFTMLLWAGKAAAISVTHGPYLQMVGENEAVVVWTTDKEALSWVEVAPDDGDHFYARQRAKYYETNFGKKRFGTVHKVLVSNLEKGTAYRYRVLSKEVVVNEPYRVAYGDVVATDVFRKKPLRFRTSDSSAPETSFVVVNDIHDDNGKLKDLLGDTVDEKREFVIFNGDMTSHLDSEKQMFEGFVDTSVSLFASETPFYMARGNHEARGVFADRFMDYFPTSTGLPYYTFRRGPVFFVVMDSGEDKPDDDVAYFGTSAFDDYRADEAEWLRSVVESKEYKSAPFKVVVIHMPPVANTWHGPLHVREQFLPILNKAGVDLMLCAHLHKYVYSGPGENGAEFPILVNSNDFAVKVQAGKRNMSVVVVDRDGKELNRYSYESR